MSGEFEGLGLSPELEARFEELGRRGAARQAAKDENLAAVRASELGLTGREAENFKAEYLANLQAGREAARQHVKAVLESPEGRVRPSAALDVAMRSDLTTDQAIAKLASMPAEVDESQAAADMILNAGKGP